MIKSNKGLTLVELVVSLAILGIIVAPLSSFFVNTIKINKNSEDRLTANQIAQKYMEEAKFGKIEPSNETISRTDKISETEIFETKIKIEEHSKYKIDKEMKKEVIEGEKDPDKDKSITYHGEIEINKDEDDTKPDKIKFKDTNIISQDDTISDNGLVNINIKKVLDNKITINFDKKYTKTVNDIDLNDINIKINCNGNRSPINLDVSTLNNVKTNIYVVKSETTKNTLKLKTSEGKVRLYNNIYDESVSKDEDSWIYKITVTVTKNDKKLAKLVGYKNID